MLWLNNAWPCGETETPRQDASRLWSAVRTVRSMWRERSNPSRAVAGALPIRNALEVVD